MANFFKSIGRFLTGSPAKRENVSLLTSGQQPLHDQLVAAGLAPGAGGAFGTVADYYRNLMSDDSVDYNAFSAPMLRQYNEDIVPGISEQFAGMGAGGLSSSGFRNAQVQGATDLAERLGALRANLRQAGAAGLANIGQMGLNPISQNMETRAGTGGLLGYLAPAVGNAGAQFFGPAIGAAGQQFANNWFGGRGQKVGANTSPYGQSLRASAMIPPQSQFQLPNFNPNMRGY